MPAGSADQRPLRGTQGTPGIADSWFLGYDDLSDSPGTATRLSGVARAIAQRRRIRLSLGGWHLLQRPLGERPPSLLIAGALPDGRKKLMAAGDSYRESTQSSPAPAYFRTSSAAP